MVGWRWASARSSCAATLPGFVANRLQYALLREAYALVEAGICDVADVDTAVTAALGARWAAIGPFATMDLAGLGVHAAVAEAPVPRPLEHADGPGDADPAASARTPAARATDAACSAATSLEQRERVEETRDRTLVSLARGRAIMTAGAAVRSCSASARSPRRMSWRSRPAGRSSSAPPPVRR